MEDFAKTIRLYKILNCAFKLLEDIQRPEGSWTEAISEPLELLFDTHFPGSVSLAGQALYQIMASLFADHSSLTVNPALEKWTIRSFKSLRSTGLVVIILGDIQDSALSRLA